MKDDTLIQVSYQFRAGSDSRNDSAVKLEAIGPKGMVPDPGLFLHDCRGGHLIGVVGV